MNNNLDTEKLIGISALLVHAAKIDGNFTEKEKQIIRTFLKNFDQNDSIIENIVEKAEKLENNTNQLLSFTNIIKKNSLESKSIVVKELWKIILSDNNSDEYESNLMRRVCGLIYFPDKKSGEIKMKILKSNLT
ncbi:MAG: tellurite resistance protein B (TerB) family [Pelagibacterales bacterium]|jgi:uncharacterized tellurite resistance protein B-like protein|nr:tellurite resistance protein B (TerB) family [Pelagibacterales bacterium]|tara:strand:+ start:208 stop:609 length:402 start_codon:yes stop_codon:yes gene_type:complete